LQLRTDGPKLTCMSRTFPDFRAVIALWGSSKDLASDLGTSPERTRKWSERNSIPAEWWLSILTTSVARRNGLTADALAAIADRALCEVSR